MGRKRNGRAVNQTVPPAEHDHDGFSGVDHPNQSKGGAKSPAGDDMLSNEWVQAVIKIGVPGAIAIFLVYRLVGGFDQIDARLRAFETQQDVMVTRQNQIITDAAATKDIAGRTLMTSERILWVLQITCANAAATAQDRRDCLRE